MPLRISHHLLLSTFLCLSLIFLILFHEYFHNYSKISTINIHKQSIRSYSLSSFSHHDQRRPITISRKVLASKIDFTSFVHPHQQRQRSSKTSPDDHHHMQALSKAPSDDPTEIDPRYGVEKRRVPTGPNPLHH
ncbi:hypothetical protein C1H46_036447 [Malus baccata]|uniref:Uncharacterized protein n=1 Tax=Malus baccata TaxID=106549 RepID=A0A540KUT4_MALBA|nr:hypothetical protein C1H46_036447 [Malus baccata]